MILERISSATVQNILHVPSRKPLKSFTKIHFYCRTLVGLCAKLDTGPFCQIYREIFCFHPKTRHDNFEDLRRLQNLAFSTQFNIEFGTELFQKPVPSFRVQRVQHSRTRAKLNVRTTRDI